MSMELQNKHGRNVGSEEYFRDLNVENYIGALMCDSKKCDYYDTFRVLSEKIHRAFDEIYGDLKSNCDIIRYIPQKDRDNLDHVIMGLDAVCEITGSHSRTAGECLAALALQSRLTKKHSNAKHSEIERAAKLVTHGRIFNKNESMRIVQETVEHGERRAVGSDRAKKQFLETVKGGKDDDFLKDVWVKLNYDSNPRRYKGKCGQELGTQKYIDHIEQHVFGHNMSNYYSCALSKSSYKAFLLEKLEKIAEIIRRDLKAGERDNDYITDESAARIKIAIAELERCGVKYGGSKERIDRLAWFVGGDPQQIRELQKMLNELGIEGERGRLKVDGVYSPNTHSAWLNFLNKLENGAVPALAWVDPLQTNLTNISIGATTNGKRDGLSNAFMNEKHPFIRVDPAPKSGGKAKVNGKEVVVDYKHINFDKIQNPSALYESIRYKYDHYPISDKAYKTLTHMKKIGKQVRAAGKVLFIAGVVLDILELGLAISADVKDIGKWGCKIASTAAGIVGRWAGAIAGAKLGAMTGAAAGTAVAPGPGTVAGGAAGGLVLGIVGAFAGDEFARWMLDVSCLED